MSEENRYKYRVLEECLMKHCGKYGLVEITKYEEESQFLVMCVECRTSWADPSNLTSESFSESLTELTREIQMTDPTDEEVRELGWDKYLLIPLQDDKKNE